ncbi:MAG: hypothetical protein H6738_17300 [Alphaproteobacteria bacterium]|nr:hypothetical protein [Alphaproteobacteria bacterium]MCB9698542.1 hypothetical protein [Alphaproteobacteria bacterium]
MSPAELAAAAREVLLHPGAEGWWSRAGVLLARQALERELARRLIAKGGTTEATFTAQLLVLPDLLGDERLAGDVAWAWAALSDASHHHGYELPPTEGEVRRWLDVVDRFVAA